MTSIPAASQRVIEAGRSLGVAVEVTIYPEGTKTAVAAAAAVGCEVSAIVKSLVFTVDGRPVVALVPGDLRLDTAKLAAAFGGGASARAGLEEVRAATGFAAGGTPPFGHVTELPVVADPALRRHDVVWAAAGTPTTVFPITPEDLGRAASARWVDVTV
ncbi:MAG TPA: YbaK/EbsC family protein [Acidimicrobiia bacterium]|nr:YbaK/EbsC family protein [Acidimicrobiia bacterium]